MGDNLQPLSVCVAIQTSPRWPIPPLPLPQAQPEQTVTCSDRCVTTATRTWKFSTDNFLASCLSEFCSGSGSLVQLTAYSLRPPAPRAWTLHPLPPFSSHRSKSPAENGPGNVSTPQQYCITGPVDPDNLLTQRSRRSRHRCGSNWYWSRKAP